MAKKLSDPNQMELILAGDKLQPLREMIQLGWTKAGDSVQVSGRKLHTFLEVGTDFTTWAERKIVALQLVAGQDYEVRSPEMGSKHEGRGGHNRKDYLFTLRNAKRICANEKGDVAAAASLYFVTYEEESERTKAAAREAALVPAIDMSDPLALAREHLKLTQNYIEAEEGRREAVAKLECAEATVVVAQQELTEEQSAHAATRAHLETPKTGTSPSAFFKETADRLGYTRDSGFAYLRERGILLKVKRTGSGTPQYRVGANYDRLGYFTHHRHRQAVMHRNGFVEDAVSLYLTGDTLGPDGQIVKVGGYRWLLEFMLKDDATTMNRMVAENDGPRGRYRGFFNKKLSIVRDASLPGLGSIDRKIILAAELPEDKASKMKWVCGGCSKKGLVARAEGATLRAALHDLHIVLSL